MKTTNYHIGAIQNEKRAITNFVDFGPLFHYLGQHSDIFQRSELTRSKYNFNFSQTCVFMPKIGLCIFARKRSGNLVCLDLDLCFLPTVFLYYYDISSKAKMVIIFLIIPQLHFAIKMKYTFL